MQWPSSLASWETETNFIPTGTRNWWRELCQATVLTYQNFPLLRSDKVTEEGRGAHRNHQGRELGWFHVNHSQLAAWLQCFCFSSTATSRSDPRHRIKTIEWISHSRHRIFHIIICNRLLPTRRDANGRLRPWH